MDKPRPERNMLTPPVNQNDHTLGGDRALVTLVEFGDYECPFCGRAHPIVKDALRRMPDEILFVFRHFPLSQAHPHSLPAAVAVEAAGAQGKFWPMHDTLFENQKALEDEDLIGYAEDLELDVGRFVADVKSGRHLQKVRSDFRSGARSGVNGTPTFFIDGKRFDENWSDGTLTVALAMLVRARAEDASRRTVQGAPH
jgi:protein-disulfide isomerase